MRWPLQPVQPFQQTQLQPPFGQSVASLCHPWFTTTNFSYRFPIFETSATALCGTTGILCKQGSRWRFPKSWGYPQSSIDWDFPWNKPSSYPHDYGTPRLFLGQVGGDLSMGWDTQLDDWIQVHQLMLKQYLSMVYPIFFGERTPFLKVILLWLVVQ